MPSSMSLGPSDLATPQLITLEQTGLWLSKGWSDFKRVPALSLLFGGIFPALGILLTVILHEMHMDSLVFLLAFGFVLIGPVAATCLYEIARRLELGLPLTVPLIIGSMRQRLTAIGDLSWALMMIFLVWLMIGLGLFALFFSSTPPAMGDFVYNMIFNPGSLPFLVVSTVIGGCLAAVAFSVSMFAMPMLMDKDVTAIKAAHFSVRAVLGNWKQMIGWAATVAVLTFVSMSIAFVGLILTFPVIAYASWHAYRDVTGWESCKVDSMD